MDKTYADTVRLLLAVAPEVFVNDIFAMKARRLSTAHKQFLSGLARSEPDWSPVQCQHAAQLPALRWKLANLETFRKRRPDDLPRNPPLSTPAWARADDHAAAPLNVLGLSQAAASFLATPGARRLCAEIAAVQPGVVMPGSTGDHGRLSGAQARPTQPCYTSRKVEVFVDLKVPMHVERSGLRQSVKERNRPGVATTSRLSWHFRGNPRKDAVERVKGTLSCSQLVD